MCWVWHPANIMPHSVHFLLSFFLIINRFTTIILSADSSDLPSTCPIWTYMYPSPSGNECICRHHLKHVVICNPETLAVKLMWNSFASCYWMIMVWAPHWLVPVHMITHRKCLRTWVCPESMRTAGCVRFTIERDSFAENVQKTTPFPPLHTTLAV